MELLKNLILENIDFLPLKLTCKHQSEFTTLNAVYNCICGDVFTLSVELFVRYEHRIKSKIPIAEIRNYSVHSIHFFKNNGDRTPFAFRKDDITNKIDAIMKRRICHEVITLMMEHIPADQTELIEALKWNFEDSQFKSPEEVLQWQRTAATLEKHIPKPAHDWEFRILSIFTTKTIEEIKSSINQ